ncbi:MAG TPA: pyridoxal phosphate-dependent aminotransferase [Pyrinomonadaceae bacterium]
MTTKKRPDIRALTRLVPRSGNLVQGQSELTIHPSLAASAIRRIAASDNHYLPAEGDRELRLAVSQQIKAHSGIEIDPEAKALELLITPGATGALVSIAQSYLLDASALVFEPYYPYHRYILDELGSASEVFPLRGESLELDADELFLRCKELKKRAQFPLKAIIACSPANPTGKVFTSAEREAIADVCMELDLLCIADEVYEHYVSGPESHVSIATLPGMKERTITVNSFSKSWNISGWRLGYCCGPAELIAPLNRANNIFYVCSPTPLQKALGEVLMSDAKYYDRLRERFTAKREFAVQALSQSGFRIYESGSTFYIWARTPDGYKDAIELNDLLIREAQVSAVPGAAFSDSNDWDSYLRLCIAREDEVLQGALEKISNALSTHFACH